MTPAAVHHGRRPRSHAARARVLDAAYAASPRTVRPQAARPAQAADRRLDQQATTGRNRRSINSNTKRLTELDRLRALATLERGQLLEVVEFAVEHPRFGSIRGNVRSERDPQREQAPP